MASGVSSALMAESSEEQTASAGREPAGAPFKTQNPAPLKSRETKDAERRIHTGVETQREKSPVLLQRREKINW